MNIIFVGSKLNEALRKNISIFGTDFKQPQGTHQFEWSFEVTAQSAF